MNTKQFIKQSRKLIESATNYVAEMDKGEKIIRKAIKEERKIVPSSAKALFKKMEKASEAFMHAKDEYTALKKHDFKDWPKKKRPAFDF